MSWFGGYGSQGPRFPNIDLAKALLVCLNATPTTVPLTTGG